LRDVAVVAEAPSFLRLAAGADALTDAEVAQVEAAVLARLRSSIEAMSTAPLTSSRVVRAGQAEITRARVAVKLGRDVHRHQATCRIRVVVDGAVVADAEGEVLRTIPVRNVSAVELRAVGAAIAASGGRNPLIGASDVGEAVVDACDVAMRAVTFDVRPEDAVVDDPRQRSMSAPSSPELRARTCERRRRGALATLAQTTDEQARAAALVVLIDAGVVDDAPIAAAQLGAVSPLVRRAAAAAFDALCAGHGTLAPSAKTGCVKPRPSSPAVVEPAGAARRPEPPARPVAGEQGDEDDEDDESDENDANDANDDAMAPELAPSPPAPPSG
jgi:hypothetical protein